jgi:sec-independent protein translocase protein TatA
MSPSPLVLAAFGFGSTELLLVLALVLLLFGGSKLPSLARGLGQSVKEFKKASKDEEDEKPAAEAKKPEPAATNTTPTGTK